MFGSELGMQLYHMSLTATLSPSEQCDWYFRGIRELPGGGKNGLLSFWLWKDEATGCPKMSAPVAVFQCITSYFCFGFGFDVKRSRASSLLKSRLPLKCDTFFSLPWSIYFLSFVSLLNEFKWSFPLASKLCQQFAMYSVPINGVALGVTEVMLWK